MIVAVEKACNILHETVIKYDWEQTLTLSISKIKPFFSKTPEKMEEIMEQMEIDGSIWKTYPYTITTPVKF